MAAHLTVSFVTPQKHVSKVEVDMVVAPSAMGELGILPGHRTLLADLVPGVVELRHGGGAKVERFAVGSGFVEVDRDKVAILVDSAERPEEIDVERAQKTLATHEAALARTSAFEPEYADHEAHVQRARVRLKVAGKG